LSCAHLSNAGPSLTYDNASRRQSPALCGISGNVVAIQQHRRSCAPQGVRFKSLDSRIDISTWEQSNQWYGSCSRFFLQQQAREYAESGTTTLQVQCERIQLPRCVRAGMRRMSNA